jgi:hypothetical protein
MKTVTQMNKMRLLLVVCITNAMSNSSATLAKDGIPAASAMTKWKTTLSFVETPNTCSVCYAGMHSLQRRTADGATNKLHSIIARFASSGIMTAKKASIIAPIAVYVELDRDWGRISSIAR